MSLIPIRATPEELDHLLSSLNDRQELEADDPYLTTLRQLEAGDGDPTFQPTETAERGIM